MRVILRSAGFFSFRAVRLKTGSYWAEESFRPVGPTACILPAFMSQLFWTLRPPAGSCCLYTVDSPWIWTQPNINICLASFIVHLFKIIWDFFTSVGLGTTPLVAATMLAVNVSTNNRVLQGDICCISRSHYKIISHLSHQQVEVEARRANKAARPQFYSHLRLYVCKETCEHLVRYLSREDRHPDPWPAF